MHAFNSSHHWRAQVVVSGVTPSTYTCVQPVAITTLSAGRRRRHPAEVERQLYLGRAFALEKRGHGLSIVGIPSPTPAAAAGSSRRGPAIGVECYRGRGKAGLESPKCKEVM